MKARLNYEFFAKDEKTVEDISKKYDEAFSKEKKIKIEKKEIGPPTKNKEEYSGFIELEATLDNYPTLIDFCARSNPTFLEILDPHQINMELTEATDLAHTIQANVTELTRAIHEGESNNKMLNSNFNNLLVNFMLYIIDHTDATLKVFVEQTGMREDVLKQVIKALTDNKILKEEGGKYKRGEKGVK